MYIYLCSNANGFPLALSPADFMKQLNVSKSSYDRAVDDLLAAGYLMMRNDKKNTMDFYTAPQPTTYVKKERKKKPATGGGPRARNLYLLRKPPANYQPKTMQSIVNTSPPILPFPISGRRTNLLPLFHARSA